jgi:hypothetical protein
VNDLAKLVNAAPGLPPPRPVASPDPDNLELESVTLPRDAFFGATRDVPADEAVGEIAADQITPIRQGYPPSLLANDQHGRDRRLAKRIRGRYGAPRSCRPHAPDDTRVLLSNKSR